MKDHLYRTRFEGRSVKVREAGDTVTVEYPRFAYGWRRANRSVVTLKGDLLWRIDCRGTLSELRADLGAIRLRSFDVQNGAARLLVTLPRPVGEVPIRLALGVRQATFQRPSGVAARVHIERGAVGLALDDHRFKAVSGALNWESANWAGADDRYVITILGGAKQLTVDTLEGPPDLTGRSGRALTTVVFTDIVGSTARALKAGDRPWRELLDRHDAAALRLVGVRGGELVKSTGDGVLALFGSPGDAIGFAREFREEARALGVDIRTGVHTGEVEYRGADVGGIGVHIASRVMNIADPGEVLVSRTVRDLVAGSDLDLQDRGTHSLRGVGGEWQVFSVP